MAHDIQVTVDCHDPHTLADWWAETLDWVVEPTDDAFIQQMIDAGYASADDTLIHRGVQVWRAGAAICRGDEVGQPGRLRILFQPVLEDKTVKNRVHLDINLGGKGHEKDALRAALEERGARYLSSAHQGPHSWYVMADPEGNEFCIG